MQQKAEQKRIEALTKNKEALELRRAEEDRLYKERLLLQKQEKQNNYPLVPIVEDPNKLKLAPGVRGGNNLQKTRRKNGLNSHSSKPFLGFTSKTKYNQQKRISRNKKTNHRKKNKTHKKTKK